MTSLERTEKPASTPMLVDPWPRLVDWFEAMVPADFGIRTRQGNPIRIEEFTRNGDHVVRAEIPGVDPEKDIDVIVVNGTLRIEGTREERHEEEHRSEFFYGHFLRTLPLPAGCDESSVTATYEDGILEVAVRMPHKGAEARHVPIAAARRGPRGRRLRTARPRTTPDPAGRALGRPRWRGAGHGRPAPGRSPWTPCGPSSR